MSKNSYILGSATVFFGGSIGISVGINPEKKTGGIMLTEFKEEHKVGDKLGEEEENFGEQVQLVFNDTKSLSIFRTALDHLEYALKYGQFPEDSEDSQSPSECNLPQNP